MNTGKAYELLTQSIFQDFLNQDSAENIDVQHNVTLQGRTTTHQIDVLWKFKVAGIEYLTIVQTKELTGKITKGAVFTFKGVLDDLPGQPRGVMVTTVGFQAGALEVANAHGIELYQLRPIGLNIQLPYLGYAKLEMDPVKKELRATNFAPDYRVEFKYVRKNHPMSMPTDTSPMNMHVIDSSGTAAGTIHDLLFGYVNQMQEAGPSTKTFMHEFDAGTTLKVEGIEDSPEVISMHTVITIKACSPYGTDVLVKHILKNLANGEVREFLRQPPVPSLEKRTPRKRKPKHPR